MDDRKVLFLQFLKDKRTYNLNVSYWRIKLQKALDEKISSKDQFIKNRTMDGVNFYDGNPIYSHYSISKDKAIRIIQEDPIGVVSFSEIKLIDAWIDKIWILNNKHDEREIEELVISVFLTHSSVEKCLELVKAWFFGGLDKSNLHNFLVDSN